MDFDCNYLLGRFQSSQFVCSGGCKIYCHIVRDVKLDAQEKLFVLTGISVLIELCRVTGYLRLTLIFA